MSVVLALIVGSLALVGAGTVFCNAVWFLAGLFDTPEPDREFYAIPAEWWDE